MKTNVYLIVHLTTVHNPGDTRILRRECASLACLDKYRVVLLNGQGVDREQLGVRISSFGKFGSRWGRLTFGGWKAYRAAVALQADLYHIHDPELLVVAYALKRRGFKVVFDCHEDFARKAHARSWIPGPFRSLFGFIFTRLAHVIVPKLDGLIAAAPHIEKSLPAVRSSSIGNLPSVDYIRRGTENVERQKDLILYTGGITPNRGIEEVANGLVKYCRLPWRLVILGRNDENVSDRMALVLDDQRISYAGPVDFDEVVKYMGRAAVGVVCNQNRFDYEKALPNKLFEYMAAGLPVVCSDFQHWRRLVDESGAGLVCRSEDPESIAEAIGRILQDPAMGEEMGKCGRAMVSDNLCWEKEVEKLYAFYEEILANEDVPA